MTHPSGGVPVNRRAADGLPPLGSVIADLGLSARRGLGQNFLLDLNLTRGLARDAASFTGLPLDQGTIIEVGPGPGGLTRALLSEGAQRLVVVERDERCLPALEAIGAHWAGRLEIVQGDALKTPLRAFQPAPRRIIANLPYNIATKLILDWLDAPEPFQGLAVMVQREVAERLRAEPGTRDYGRLSVAVRWRAEVSVLRGLPARAFTPVPKVDSAFVGLRPLSAPPYPADPKALERVTAAAFGQRRKMLRGSLRSLPGPVEGLIEAAGLDPSARAEEIDLRGYCALARALTAAESEPKR